MKNKLILVFALVLCFTIGIFISSNNYIFANEQSFSNERLLTVVGEAEIEIEPDIAYINIGIKTEAMDSKNAQSENDQKMKKVTEKLLELGIDAKNIKTSSYSLYPKYNYDRETGESNIVGYIADNTVTVDILDINKLGVVIDKVIQDGANVINGIGFDVSNREELYNKALKEAVKKTEKKALTMVEAFGIKKVNSKEIIEQSSYNTGALLNYKSFSMNEMAMDSGASISAGEIKVKAIVSAKYSY